MTAGTKVWWRHNQPGSKLYRRLEGVVLAVLPGGEFVRVERTGRVGRESQRIFRVPVERLNSAELT